MECMTELESCDNQLCSELKQCGSGESEEVMIRAAEQQPCRRG